MRVLCLDVGSKTIGVAVSDPLGWTAQPILTIKRTTQEADRREIERLIQEYEVDKIVVGLPLRMDGSEQQEAAGVRKFVEKVTEWSKGIPIVLWDERLSTVAAERSLIEADLSREKRRKVINQMAAVFILQGYLDSLQVPPPAA